MFNRIFRNRLGQNRSSGDPNTSQGRGAGRGAGGAGAGRGSGGGGKGQGHGSKPGSGPEGNCLCPKCGHKEPHVAGQRCVDQVCPKCGTKMIRE